ncbi:hypothetical protein [Methylococcus mesophilus]|uniref:hypothetical protein n=1 Tax=Methylococcus mesophilus TaxID=2993564 RepID=UPI00224A5377|nr:hypothetical protein [Methylococcus mesophilus]UZR27977.1 hypothetical protein OOT43_14820 [Methylococcus mesophilus]
MSRYAQLLALCLLVLTQMWAPLVHAHTATGEPRGEFHVPGLEFLERLPEEGWHAPDAGPESTIVVAMQCGILEPSRISWPCREDKPAPDAVPGRIETEAPLTELAKARPPTPFTLPPYASLAAKPFSARGPPR